MVINTELKTGKKYWFLSNKHGKLIDLTFMNKVEGRNAFRFAEKGKKRLFLVHNVRLSHLYARKWEATLALKLLDGRKAIRRAQDQAQATADRVRAYYGGQELYPPRLEAWGVAYGFPRRVRFGRW